MTSSLTYHRSVADTGLQVLDLETAGMVDAVCDRIVPGSLVPRTLSVNPSLTIMALADRLAGHLDADPYGYLA